MKIWSLLIFMCCVLVPLDFYAQASPECDENITEDCISDQAIVFDWDDTLLPTSFLKKLGNRSVTVEVLRSAFAEDEETWDKYDEFVYHFLKKLNKKSDVYIISNAPLKSLKLSSEILMPRTREFFDLLEEKNRLISARDYFINNRAEGIAKYNIDISKIRSVKDTKWYWKQFAFISYLNKYKSIISIGDAEYERVALREVDCENKNRIVKTNVTLAKCEDFYVLHDQVLLIYRNWKSIKKKSHKENSNHYITVGFEDNKENIDGNIITLLLNNLTR